MERWLTIDGSREYFYRIDYSFETGGGDPYGDTGNICSKTVSGPGHLWWNPAWTRKSLVKILHEGEKVENYQALIKLDTASLISAGEMRGDCADIRLVNYEQDAELSFWTDPRTIDSDSTHIWVKIPALEKGENFVYIYYGNFGAVSASDGGGVFDGFDDFADGDYSQKWSVVSGSWAESGGVLAQTSAAVPASIEFKDDVTLTDYILETWAKKTGGNEGFLITFRAGNVLPWWNLGGWGNTKSLVEQLADTEVNPDSVTSQEWYHIKLIVNFSGGRYAGYRGTGGSLDKQWDVTKTYINQSGSQNSNKISLAAWSTQAQFDRWLIRKYVSIEPVSEIVRTFTKPDVIIPVQSKTYNYQYQFNRLTKITNPDNTEEIFTYDQKGQLTKRQKFPQGGGAALETTTYHWSLQGMLEKVILPSGEPVEYRYDGAGRLTGRKTADGEDLFVQTGWDIVEKRSVGIDRHSQYPQGADWQGQGSQGQNREGQRTYYTGLSSIKEGEKVRYYLYNHRGDTVLVTGGDGEIIHNLSYEAYGKATDKLGYPAGSVNIETGGGLGAGGGSGVNGGSESFGGGAGSSGATSSGAGSNGGRDSVFPQLFAGAYGIRYDAKTNLHYMRYRWYSQTQMRFISLDLIRNANRYSYTNGNPIMYVDPTGLKEEVHEYKKDFYEEATTIVDGEKHTIFFNSRYDQMRKYPMPEKKLDPQLIVPSRLSIRMLNRLNNKLRIENRIKKEDPVTFCDKWVLQFVDYVSFQLHHTNLNKLRDDINNEIKKEEETNFSIKSGYYQRIKTINAYYGHTEQEWHKYNTIGHHYVYLEFITTEGLSFWILSETNFSGTLGWLDKLLWGATGKPEYNSSLIWSPITRFRECK